MYSITLVPLYDTLGPDACTFIINQAQLTLIVCDEPSKVGDNESEQKPYQ